MEQLLPTSVARSEESSIELAALRGELAVAKRIGRLSLLLAIASLLCALAGMLGSQARTTLQRESPPLKHLMPNQHYVDLQELAIYQVKSSGTSRPRTKLLHTRASSNGGR